MSFVEGAWSYALVKSTFSRTDGGVIVTLASCVAAAAGQLTYQSGLHVRLWSQRLLGLGLTHGLRLDARYAAELIAFGR